MTSTRLPQVDKILRHPDLVALQETFRRDILADIVRGTLSSMRDAKEAADVDAIVRLIQQQVTAVLTPSMQKVINATGIVLNTNLGRAPIARSTLSDLVAIGSGYCNLEIDMTTGKRGKRTAGIQRLLRLLTACEGAVVVNNNAAAVLLAVNALAKGKKVIVSRGELIEIGGSFRLPDVVEAAGGILLEVGCTNKTRAKDYEEAIDENTGLILRCHRSNFEISGFTEEPQLDELRAISTASGIPLLEDLGSGVLFEMTTSGIAGEPTVKELVSSGCDLVCFSGDKLMGGPQAGFIVGRQTLVDKLARNPLYRALRLDKLTLSLAERCLISYLSPHPQTEVPILAMLSESVESLKARSHRVVATVSDTCKLLQCEPVPTLSAAGGGSLPGETLDSYGIELTSKGVKAQRLVDLLRETKPPVIATIKDNRLLLDFRTIAESDEELLVEALKQVSTRLL